MANFGLSKPWMGKLNAETGKYSNQMKCSKAINTSVSPNYNEASLFADNQQTENVTEFKNANVSLGVDRIPIEVGSLLFGHNVGADGGEVSKSEDSANYVGYGFITTEIINGVKKYRSCFLPKVQFKEGEESYETKGDSIVLKTPTLSGVAMCNAEGEWREKSPYYETEAEAEEWLKEKFGVVEKCETPVASIKGGEHTGVQTVTLSTSTTGATIMYTTDGTTPSDTNGTVYKSSISISTNTGLRAIAYKDNAITSGVMVEEYFIKATE